MQADPHVIGLPSGHFCNRYLYIRVESSNVYRSLLVLTAAMFAIGTDSFVIAGILPGATHSLGGLPGHSTGL
ncbi:hypothetical protein BFF78_37840 [Streptomyces fodineus]|uniref:Uncharacterized protein n=1 Tax=Streptomyces fodineus TaxID=1904616 RepID=A0A1D7YKK7_9ACTN|nr:hypothetical protein BFF78_37840 [Streptomyces fodineus]